MPEHVHLLVFPNHVSYDISTFTRAIKQPVSRRAMRYLEKHDPQWLPKLTRTRGKRTERLFRQSGGGYDRNIVEPNALHATVDYIHENPVRRGLVDKAIDWSWSSARYYVGFREEEKERVKIDPLQIHRVPVAKSDHGRRVTDEYPLSWGTLRLAPATRRCPRSIPFKIFYHRC